MSKQDSSSIESRLAKYGAMSIAVASGVLAMPAHAGMITTLASAACPGNNSTTTNGSPIFFNPTTQTCGLASAGALFKLENITGFSGTVKLDIVGMTSHALLAGNGSFLTKLPSSATSAFNNGSFLGGALELKSTGGAHSGNWNDGNIDYVGLLMDATAYHYGWAQVSISGYNATLLEFAYNDTASGAPTTNGTPEPSSMAMLALGAAGIEVYRRKKAKAA